MYPLLLGSTPPPSPLPHASALVEYVRIFNVAHGPLLAHVLLNQVADAEKQQSRVLLVAVVTAPKFAILRTGASQVIIGAEAGGGHLKLGIAY